MDINLKESPVVFKEAEHEYWLGEKQLSGVTGILHAMLFADKYKGIPQAVLDKAAERGHNIHNDCYRVDSPFGFEPEYRESSNFLKILKENNLKSLAYEYVVSDEERIASAIDCVFLQKRSIILADIKTTTELDEDYVGWQLSVYAWLFEKINGIKVKALYGVWLRGEAYRFVPVKRHSVKEVEKLISDYFAGIRYEVKEDKKETPLPERYEAMKEELLELYRQKDEIDSKIEELRSCLLTDMEHDDVPTYKSDWITVSYTAAKDSVKFDEKAFKAAHEDLYKEFSTINKHTDASVRITIKKNNK